MGWYGSIRNKTKKQKVIGFWHKDTFCSCYHVMHQFHWDKNDKIRSFGDETCYKINYDESKNEMILEDDIERTIKIHNRYDDDFNEVEIIKKPTIEYAKYGFDDNEFREKWDDYNHVPEWLGNTCVKCEYVYDKSKLAYYEKRGNMIQRHIY